MPQIVEHFACESINLNETSHGVTITFMIAMLVVFLVLVAQFESLASAGVVLGSNEQVGCLPHLIAVALGSDAALRTRVRERILAGMQTAAFLDTDAFAKRFMALLERLGQERSEFSR